MAIKGGIARVLLIDFKFPKTSGLTISMNFMAFTARQEVVGGAVQSVIDRGIDFCWA
jgi:hypothetical protein